MNYKLLLTSAFIVSALSVSAQSTNRAYAITGDGNQDYVWMNIRQVDLGTGQVSNTLFQRSKTNFTLTDVTAKTTVTQATPGAENIFQSKTYPTGSLVAAAAYDKRSNKLFFTPMRVNELRWLDLDSKEATPKFYTIASPVLDFGQAMDESNHITRMVIGADGKGYAITNDGNHFISFTTGKKPVITDLGGLIDDPANAGISVHNKCSSWGGDMLADAFGKLYIISAAHQIFIVDIASRIATHLGMISGLPGNYTTNAAAVNADGEIVVSSANIFAGYYKFKLGDLAASVIPGSDTKYNASDLANGNLLLQKEADDAKKFSLGTAKLAPDLFGNADKNVFPNPVTSSSFSVLFSQEKRGTYSITLADLSGRVIQTQKVNLSKGEQTATVNLLSRPAKGMYLVKVYDEGKQLLMSEKVLIQ